MQNNFNGIVKNYNDVGIDCLRWNNKNSSVKIYNKFVYQVTSPLVSKQIGNHIIDFLNCPDKRLNNTFSSGLGNEHGITKLESTICNYFNAEYQNDVYYSLIDNCISLLATNNRYFEKAPFYKVSIPIIWLKITCIYQNSYCVVNKKDKLLNYAYWGYSRTNKLTGISIKLPKEDKDVNKTINYILSAFSFNLVPVSYVEILPDGKHSNNVSIILNLFIKKDSTFFTNSKTIYSVITKTIDIEAMGLLKSYKVILEVLKKGTNITNRLQTYKIRQIEDKNTLLLVSVKTGEEETQTSLKRHKIQTKERQLCFTENNKNIWDFRT